MYRRLGDLRRGFVPHRLHCWWKEFLDLNVLAKINLASRYSVISTQEPGQCLMVNLRQGLLPLWQQLIIYFFFVYVNGFEVIIWILATFFLCRIGQSNPNRCHLFLLCDDIYPVDFLQHFVSLVSHMHSSRSPLQTNGAISIIVKTILQLSCPDKIPCLGSVPNFQQQKIYPRTYSVVESVNKKCTFGTTLIFSAIIWC